MTVIIPLAGYGTRLRPFTYETPKPLMQVAGDTVIGWIFKSLSLLDVSRFVLVVGYKGDEIKEWINKNYSKLNIKWVIQEDTEGLGHAVWLAGKDIIEDEDVLIYLGDTIFDVSWDKIEYKDKNLIAVKEVKNPNRFGIVKIQNGKIIDVVEKPENPPSNLAIVGLYYINRWGDFFPFLDKIINEKIKTKDEYQLTDGLRMMLKKDNILLEPFSVQNWFDCGTKESFIQTNSHLLKKCEINEFNEDWIKNPCYIDNNSIIKKSIIGPNVSIGSDSIIENSYIENSIIWNNVHIKNSFIKDSIIGDRVEVDNLKGTFYLASDSIIIGKEEK